jgi:hypothetical protein
MNQENGSSPPQSAVDPFGGKSSYRLVWFLAVLGIVYGGVVVGVLATSPLGRTATMYTALGFGVVGIVTGARYGFFFNIVNRCKGGQILWAFIGAVLAAAAGVLAVAVLVAIVGAVAGFAAGWTIGSLLTGSRRGFAPMIGAGVGAVVQACWADPSTGLKAAALGGVCGAISGPLFLLVCMALGYFVLHGGGRSRFFQGHPRPKHTGDAQ